LLQMAPPGQQYGLQVPVPVPKHAAPGTQPLLKKTLHDPPTAVEPAVWQDQTGLSVERERPLVQF
jgi:hypothetical protein